MKLSINISTFLKNLFYTKDEIDDELTSKSDITHTHNDVSTSSNGFMLASDKSKLDGISNNANYITAQDVMNYANDNCMLFIDDNGKLILTDATLTTSDLTMTFQDGSKFTARVLEDGQPVVGETVKFTLQGVTYPRTTDTDGYAKLNINLMAGTYTMVTTYGSIANTNTIIIK